MFAPKKGRHPDQVTAYVMDLRSPPVMIHPDCQDVETSRPIRETYPTREAFYSHRFCRLLATTAAAQEIHCEACWLLTVIVHQEDHLRYREPIKFYNEQLMPLCGFGGKTRLVLARQKAIDAGWLHYEPGSKGVPGTYWTLIPQKYMDIPDGAIDESSDEFCRTEIERQTRSRTESGRQVGRQTDGNQDDKPASSNPNPIPSPIPKEEEPPKSATPTAAKRLVYSDEDMATAHWMFDRVREVVPNEDQPKNFNAWANDIRLMRERDNRTDDQIRQMFLWANNDNFWRINIRCPATLRTKWSTLNAQKLDLRRDRNGNKKHLVGAGQQHDPTAAHDPEHGSW